MLGLKRQKSFVITCSLLPGRMSASEPEPAVWKEISLSWRRSLSEIIIINILLLILLDLRYQSSIIHTVPSNGNGVMEYNLKPACMLIKILCWGFMELPCGTERRIFLFSELYAWFGPNFFSRTAPWDPMKKQFFLSFHKLVHHPFQILNYWIERSILWRGPTKEV